MSKLRKPLIALVIIGGIVVVGFLGFIWVTGGSGAVSNDISDVAETIDDSVSGQLFRIDSEDSEATFRLEEDLTGIRTTVIGLTRQVGGDIVVNFDDPQASQVGTITINARNLATDQEMRNRAIRSQILLSSQDENEFIEFEPTEIIGLPESITISETYTFDIVGNLTIVGTTNEVTFASTVTLDSESQISGSATTTIAYADWGIIVPDAVGVANVSDIVELTINFEADLVEETEE